MEMSVSRTPAPRIPTPADKLELHELNCRYADIIDHKDWGRLTTIFVPEAVFQITSPGRDRRLAGITAIQDYMEHEAHHPAAHHITNVYVDHGIDGEIRLHTRLLLVQHDRTTESGGAYDDVVRFRRVRDGGLPLASTDFTARNDRLRTDRSARRANAELGRQGRDRHRSRPWYRARGRARARAPGAKVVVNDLGATVATAPAATDPAQQSVDEIKGAGGDAVADSDDVTSHGMPRGDRSARDRRFGGLDILVNNAGFLPRPHALQHE